MKKISLQVFPIIPLQMQREESQTLHRKSVEIISDLRHNKNLQRSHSVDIIDISDDGESDDKDDKENGGEVRTILSCKLILLQSFISQLMPTSL